MGDHGNRSEDMGFGRVLKFWPLLVAIFTAGAWYQSEKNNGNVIALVQKQTTDHEKRITQVEDAVVYLKELVAIKRAERGSR